MSKAWSKGSTRAWRKSRAFVLMRDRYRCQIGSAQCVTIADSADHIIPKGQGGSDDPSNLQAACTPCNTSRGAPVGDPEPLGRW